MKQGKEGGERGMVMECFTALHSFGQVPTAHNLDAKRRTCTLYRRIVGIGIVENWPLLEFVIGDLFSA